MSTQAATLPSPRSPQTTIASLPDGGVFPPDIAINEDGNTAYAIKTAEHGSTFVYRVDLQTGHTTITAVPIKPVLPPRISFERGELHVLALTENESSPETYSRPGFTLFRISSTLSSKVQLDLIPAVPGSVDLDGSIPAVATEFDFDCYQPSNQFLEEICVVVAQVRATTSPNRPSSIYSIRYSISPPLPIIGSFTAKILDEDFSNADYYAANRIVSVAADTSHLRVSHGRLLRPNLDDDNTRISKYNGDSVANQVVNSKDFNNDGDSCYSVVNIYGRQMPPGTTYGGTSIAYCPSCRVGGSVESVSWGRRGDNDTFCH